MTPTELMDGVFKDADEAHAAHLATRSYAEHMALGEFYDGARGASDAIIEAMIGLGMPVPPAQECMCKYLEKKYIALADARDETCNEVPELENLYDELLWVYVKAIYKLKRFK